MKICFLFFLFMNLIAFLLMGLDKSYAKKHKWRISESVLFFTAATGGSIGILTGMAVFHHKTKHLSFRIGIPLILFIQLFIIYLLCK